jgi:outer membrane protein OmpA-like peptidoglycan-associated protein
MADPASSGPSSFGSSLLAKSKANPGSIDMSIFAPKSKPVGQGAVSSDYLQKTREDNPDPESSEHSTDSVILGVCKITTPVADLSTDQPFEMSVEAKGAGPVTFNLFCTLPKSDGTEEVQDQSSPSQATIADGVAKAKGNLVSPKSPVPLGTNLKYHVVAERPNATEKSTSDKVEVEAGAPPKPLAVLTLGAVHFGFGSSFLLPSAAEKAAEFQKSIASNPGAAVAVFGHADPTGDDDPNKVLAGRRAYAVYCLLAKKADGWSELAKGATGDKWDLRTTQTMLEHLKDDTGAPYYGGSVDGVDGPKTKTAVTAFQKTAGLKVDGVAGPKTHAALYAKYMDGICQVTCAPEDFVGDPADAKRQWACVGCGEFNPLLVFGQADADKFAKATDKTERDGKNAPNRRATVFLFPATAKGPGKVRFPCPARDEGSAKCKEQFFEDGDKRRNPQDAERTWESDQNTFACKFYARIGKMEKASGSDTPVGPAGILHFGEIPFATGSAVPAPAGATRLVRMLARALRSDGSSLVITGHADPPGSEADNQKLSEARSRSVLSLATGDVDGWWSAVSDFHIDPDLRDWCGHLHQAYGWDCDPANFDGGTSAFQSEYNLRHSQTIQVDGSANEATWKALGRTIASFVAFAAAADAEAAPSIRLGLGGSGHKGFGEEFHAKRVACILAVPEGVAEAQIKAAVDAGPVDEAALPDARIGSIHSVLTSPSGTGIVSDIGFVLNAGDAFSLQLRTTLEGVLSLPDLPCGEYPLDCVDLEFSTTIGSSGSQSTLFRLDGFQLPDETEDADSDEPVDVDEFQTPAFEGTDA